MCKVNVVVLNRAKPGSDTLVYWHYCSLVWTRFSLLALGLHLRPGISRLNGRLVDQ